MENTAISEQNLILQQMSDHALAEASGIISTITRVKIQIDLASQGLIDLQQAILLFDESEPQLVAISQKLEGIVNGHALFLLKDDLSMLLIRELLKENARLRELTEMEEEALCEIGNIIINSCLSNYMEMFKGRVHSHLPRLSRAHYSHLLQGYSDEIIDSGLFYLGLRIVTPSQVFDACLLWTSYAWYDQSLLESSSHPDPVVTRG